MVARTPPRALKIVRTDAVFAFLVAHRGEAFCGQCIADALSISWIDAALGAVDGRGVHRREGQCARCGQLQLVSRVAR